MTERAQAATQDVIDLSQLIQLAHVAQVGDELAGVTMLSWWVRANAELNCVDVHAVPLEFYERMVARAAEAETMDPATSPVEKALHLAAKGEFERAGQMTKKLMVHGAELHIQEKFAQLGANVSRQKREYSAKGIESIKARTADSLEQILNVARPLRARHPDKPDTWLAKKVQEALSKQGVRPPGRSTLTAKFREHGLSKERK